MTDRATAAGKADFDHVYDRPDPREYFRTLGELDYEIPQQAQPVFQSLVAALRSGHGGAGDKPLRVLDICCSYGINAALLRCEVNMTELFARYANVALDELSPAELTEADKAYYQQRRRRDDVLVSGLDAAGNAVAYGCEVGLLDDGWTEDLETGDPSCGLAEHLATLDLITTTGGVGYITERTFDRVMKARPERPAPWLAAFVLRMYSYDRISATLAGHGLVTQQLTGMSFPQRRFTGAVEQEATVQEVRKRGLDTAGLEDTGRYYADFYLSRPTSDAAEPLAELLAGAVQP